MIKHNVLKNSHHHSSGRYRVEGPQENRDTSGTGGGREGDGQEAGVLREHKRGQNTIIFLSFIKALEYFQKKEPQNVIWITIF